MEAPIAISADGGPPEEEGPGIGNVDGDEEGGGRPPEEDGPGIGDEDDKGCVVRPPEEDGPGVGDEDDGSNNVLPPESDGPDIEIVGDRAAPRSSWEESEKARGRCSTLDQSGTSENVEGRPESMSSVPTEYIWTPAQDP